MSFVAQKLLTTPTLHGPKERLVILDRVSQANTLFNTRSGSITVQTGVMFGHNCMVLTGIHDYSKNGKDRSRLTIEDAGRNILIKEGAWIASGVSIIAPCIIGANSVVGAGSVVISDIPDNVIAVGNPARVIREINIEK